MSTSRLQCVPTWQKSKNSQLHHRRHLRVSQYSNHSPELTVIYSPTWRLSSTSNIDRSVTLAPTGRSRNLLVRLMDHSIKVVGKVTLVNYKTDVDRIIFTFSFQEDWAFHYEV